ncbi:hypothetical protein NESM_000756600 [Novymonas esmeraldas]|uniref:Uncharacterized protein n=1 Tax=Novymonas esmeraldas TaxID=1808958 RepID=A0AAW0EV43_9TRYP
MGLPKGTTGGAHRGPHDVGASLHAPALSFADPALDSTDTMRQLLAIASGNFAGIAAATETLNSGGGGGGGRGGGEGSSHGFGTSMNSFASSSNLARIASSGGGGGGGETRPTTATTVPVSPSSAYSPASPLSLGPMRAGGDVSPPSGRASGGGGVGGDAALTDSDASAFYLTALVAQALHLDDYWVHLGHQIEVDEHVEFIAYCAREGFAALKAVHLLSWWRQYRSLVRCDGPDRTAGGNVFMALQLSDGNPQKVAPAFHPKTAGAGGGGGGGESGSAGSGPASSHGRDGGTGAGAKASKKGRRLSASMAAAAPIAAADVDGPAGASTTLSTATAPPLPPVYTTHAEALLGELQRFVQWELEHEWAWRQVPREPVPNAATSLLSPRLVSLGGSRRSTTGATAATAAKPSRADKAKLQQQQQQEMEAEEQRLARVAAMPPENIFLAKEELNTFVRFVIEDDLLSHTTLHMCVAAHAHPPMSTLSSSARGPVCFSVQVETPMAVLPLREAVRLSDLRHGSSSVEATGAAAAAAPTAAGADAAAGGGTAAAAAAPQQSPRPTSGAGHGKSAGSRSRAQSKSAAKDAAAVAEAAAAAAAAATAAAPEVTVALTAMEALRAEQAKEAAAYRRAYDEERAQSAAAEQAAQHAADVNLFFEKPNTTEAVQAVYASLEDAMAARQQRILQRVVALERALGLVPAPNGERLDAAGADGVAGAGESKPTSARAASSGGSSPGKKKGK